MISDEKFDLIVNTIIQAKTPERMNKIIHRLREMLINGECTAIEYIRFMNCRKLNRATKKSRRHNAPGFLSGSFDAIIRHCLQPIT